MRSKFWPINITEERWNCMSREQRDEYDDKMARIDMREYETYERNCAEPSSKKKKGDNDDFESISWEDFDLDDD